MSGDIGLEFYIQYISLALLYYDYLLTFPDEVKYIWKGRVQLSTFLYFCCRYALVANLLYLFAIDGRLPGSCTAWYIAIAGLSVFGRLAVIVTFTARAYLVWNERKVILGILGTVGLATVIVDSMHVPGVQCVGSTTKPIINSLVAVFMFTFEILSTFLALFRCARTLNRLEGWPSLKQSFDYMVYKQGLAYFCATAILSTSKLVLCSAESPTLFIWRLLDALVLPILCLFTARFILHLRKWERRPSEELQISCQTCTSDSCTVMDATTNV